jgi:hypothetical protein
MMRRSDSWRSSALRSSTLLLLLTAAVLVAPSAMHAGPTPTPLPADCPPGYVGVAWDYDAIPPDAQPIEGGPYDGGTALPTRWCIKQTSTQTIPVVDPYPTGIESDGRKNTETLDPPNEPLCGSGGCDITKYPAPDPKTPPAKPPFPFTAWGTPQGGCVPGVGWDFEDGTFQGWKPQPLPPNDTFPNAFDQHDKRKKTHVGLNAPPEKDASSGSRDIFDEPPGPVFGNNVDVFRMAPPGFVPAHNTAAAIGGDYWRFARGVNYSGNWWIGSGDIRRLAIFAPGKRIDELANGALLSPSCVLSSDYVSFRIGGTRATSQRVELLVEDTGSFPQPSDYQGIGGPAFASQGQAVDLPNHYPGTHFFDQAPSGWVIALASSPHASTRDDQGEYMDDWVVWDVRSFQGRKIRLRIVDDNDNSDLRLIQHVNVDDIRFHSAPEGDYPPPSPTESLSLPGGGGPSRIAVKYTPQPLWGATDAHAHVAANATIGGHTIWGDPADSLASVYSCRNNLPDIPKKDGTIARRGASTYNGSPFYDLSCHASLSLDVIVTGVIGIACSGVASFHPLLGGVCLINLINAASALSEQDTLGGRIMHDAHRFTGGHLHLEPFGQTLFNRWLLGEATGVARSQFVAGFVSSADPGNERTEHTGFGLGNTHQTYQWQMLERAWRGGLRLVVVDAHNSRAGHLIMDGDEEVTGIMSDWQAIENVVEEMKRLTAGPSDPVYFKGPLHDFARIVYSPQDAREIIESGKIAIILGVEVDELGKARFFGDTPERQADDLYKMGIRRFDIAHAIDNPYAGAALMNTNYLSLNTLLGTDTAPQAAGYPDFTPGFGSGFIRDGTNFLPSWFPSPFTKLFLPLVDKTREFPRHWFALTSDSGGWIGFTNLINYRFGADNITLAAERLRSPSGAWMELNDPNVFEMDGRVPTLEILETAAQLSTGPGGGLPDAMCELRGQVMPKAWDYLDGRSATYASFAHHRNSRGMTALGLRFQQRLMELGALISTDHLSQNSRLDAYAKAYDFGTAAPIGDSDPRYRSPDKSYPFVGEHTWLRNVNRESPVPFELKESLGIVHEGYIAEGEVARRSASQGTIAPHISGSRLVDFRLVDPNTQSPFLPRNDCDYSSKSFASAYIYAVEQMDGRGIAPSTDANGFTSPLTSRYGSAGMSRACRTTFRAEQYAGTRQNAVELHNRLLQEDDPRVSDPYYDPRIGNSPRDFLAANDATCHANSVAPAGSWNPACPSTQMIAGQYKEHSGVVYDNYAQRIKDENGGTIPGGAQSKLVVTARRVFEGRVDGAARANAAERVAIDTAPLLGLDPEETYQAQMYPLTKFNGDLVGGFDMNIDGMVHIGMYPDLLQDMRNVGVTHEYIAPLFNAADSYLLAWQRACKTAELYRATTGAAGYPAGSETSCGD